MKLLANIKKLIITLAVAVCVCSCFGDAETSHKIVGKWGMVSGGIERYGVFASIEKGEGYLKTIEFREDGSFEEVCGSAVAIGTYEVKSSQSISYSYTSVSGEGPEYFAIHSSGKWMCQFWNDDSFTLYDYSASPAFEVSMSFDRL